MIKELVFGVIGGLGLFIYGIWEMSEGLNKACEDRMRRILYNFTGNPIKGVLLGTGITSLIKSSGLTQKMVSLIMDSFFKNVLKPLESITRNELKNNHVKRLEKGEYNVLSGIVFLDIISIFEKIGDHLTNVAQAVIESLK